jgi:hypothetical protein
LICNRCFLFNLMFDIFFLVFLFIFSVFSFFEVLIFNEEALLALCFFSFLFFLFNSMNDTVFSIFQSRAAKFEVDLLSSFTISKQAVVKLFENFYASRNFISKFKIISTIATYFLSIFSDYSSFKLTRVFQSVCLTTLLELVSFESKLTTAFQKNGISLLLYPLIFQTAKNNILLLSSLNLNNSASTI